MNDSSSSGFNVDEPFSKGEAPGIFGTAKNLGVVVGLFVFPILIAALASHFLKFPLLRSRRESNLRPYKAALIKTVILVLWCWALTTVLCLILSAGMLSPNATNDVRALIVVTIPNAFFCFCTVGCIYIWGRAYGTYREMRRSGYQPWLIVGSNLANHSTNRLAELQGGNILVDTDPFEEQIKTLKSENIKVLGLRSLAYFAGFVVAGLVSVPVVHATGISFPLPLLVPLAFLLKRLRDSALTKRGLLYWMVHEDTIPL